MAQFKLLVIMLLILLMALQAFVPFDRWYGPYLAACLVIALVAALQKTGPNDEH